MTEVRIRHVDDQKAEFLADVPFSELDSVIPTLKYWGLYSNSVIDPSTLCAQFQYSDDGTYFEVQFS